MMKRRVLVVSVLASYWAALFVVSHIPIPRIVYRARVSDKVLHFVAYMLLAFLCWWAVGKAKRIDWRRLVVWVMLVVLVCYGIADELLQKFVGRSYETADMAADFAGIATAAVVMTVLTFRWSLLTITAATIFLLANVAKANLYNLMPFTNISFHVIAYGFFALVWTQNISRIKALRDSRLKWVITALSVPIVFVLVVKTVSAMTGRAGWQADMLLAFASVAAVVLFYFLRFYVKSARQGGQGDCFYDPLFFE